MVNVHRNIPRERCIYFEAGSTTKPDGRYFKGRAKTHEIGESIYPVGENGRDRKDVLKGN